MHICAFQDVRNLETATRKPGIVAEAPHKLGDELGTSELVQERYLAGRPLVLVFSVPLPTGLTLNLHGEISLEEEGHTHALHNPFSADHSISPSSALWWLTQGHLLCLRVWVLICPNPFWC